MAVAPCVLCTTGNPEVFTGKKDGRDYARCTNKMCGFFCAREQIEEYEETIAQRVGYFFLGGDAPKCFHNEVSSLRVSTSESNPGRPYFGCGVKPKCKFFTWADVESKPVLLPPPVAPYDPYLSYAPARAAYLRDKGGEISRKASAMSAAGDRLKDRFTRPVSIPHSPAAAELKRKKQTKLVIRKRNPNEGCTWTAEVA